MPRRAASFRPNLPSRTGRRHRHGLLAAFAALLLLAAGACAPTLAPPGTGQERPRLLDGAAVMGDGSVLALRHWPAQGEAKGEPAAPRAVVLGLHGFNDYSKSYESPAASWSRAGMAVYAYDQRGFGRSPHWGKWPGIEALTDDLRTMLALLRERHPGVPLAVVGESMGAAVVLAAHAPDAANGNGEMSPLPADAIVLSAPAIWARSTMPGYQRAGLWLAAHTVPWLRLSGRGLKIRASDNDAVLLALGRDPLVIKGTRVDALYGLVNLMDVALEGARQIDRPTLVLFGREEQLIPPDARRAFLAALPRAGHWRVAEYDTGYHMLFRDLNAAVVLGDVATWIGDSSGPLPSGEERAGALAVTRAPAAASAAVQVPAPVQSPTPGAAALAGCPPQTGVTSGLTSAPAAC